MPSKIALPSYLKKGDCVSLVAPASPFEKDLFENGVLFLEKCGLRVEWDESIFARNAFLAGSDASRLAEFQKACKNKKNKAIFVVRGGYGSQRFLLQKKQIELSHPKIVMGMSDVTCLMNWMTYSFKCSATHGPVVAGSMFHSFSEAHQNNLMQSLFEPQTKMLKTGRDYEVFSPGNATASLVGGNLAMIDSAIATKWDVSCKNKMLFLEDVQEPLYKLDRMMLHLFLAKKLSGLRGLLLGDFTDGKDQMIDSRVVYELMKPFIPKGIPVLGGLKIGHRHCDHLLALGQNFEIKKNGRELILPACVSAKRA